MKVCDKCKSVKSLETIKLKGKSYELCSDCLERVVVWIGKEERTNFVDRVFGGN